MQCQDTSQRRGRGSGMEAEKFTLLSNFPYAHPAPKLDSALSTSEAQARRTQNDGTPPPPVAPDDLPAPPADGSIDWAAVDSIDISSYVLATTETYVDIPGGRRARNQYVCVRGQILGEIRAAVSEQGSRNDGERVNTTRATRALKWHLLAPQLFLSTPTRGGKKQRKARKYCVAQRLLLWSAGAQRQLLTQLSSARNKHKSNPRAATKAGAGGKDDVRHLLDLLARGCYRKAINLLHSHGILDAAEIDVVAQLRSKHPQQGELGGGDVISMPTPEEYGMPNSLKETDPRFIRFPTEVVGEACMGLGREKAMAPNGGRNEHYHPFGYQHASGSKESQALADLAFLGECYANALLPAWYYSLTAAARLVALLKEKLEPGITPKVRPIAVGDIERRLFCSIVVRIHAPDFAEWLGPYQVAVGVSASAEKLVFGLRAILEKHPDFAIWKLDLKNAFNEFVRATLAQRFADAPPKLQRLLPFVCALLGPGAPLAIGTEWADFLSIEGTQQGCPLGPALFCMWFKPHLDWLLVQIQLRAGKDAAIGAIMDDAAVVAPPEVIAALIPELKIRMLREGSTLQTTKCVWAAEAEATRARFPAGAKVGRAAEPIIDASGITTGSRHVGFGVDIDGIPVGNSEFKALRHRQIVDGAAQLVATIEQALVRCSQPKEVKRHAAFVLERFCAHPKIAHLLRGAYPDDIRPHAARFDQMILTALARTGGMAAGRTKALQDDGGTGIVTKRIALPINKAGWGIRSMAVLADIAFLAGASAALPAFADRTNGDKITPGMFPALATTLMHPGAFDAGGDTYAKLSSGDTELGKAMNCAWSKCRERLLPAMQRAGDTGTDVVSATVQRRLEAHIASESGKTPRSTNLARTQPAPPRRGAGRSGNPPPASAPVPAPPTRKASRLLYLHDDIATSHLGYRQTSTHRLQRTLTMECETAEHRALLVQALTTKPPPKAQWHAPAQAEQLKAYAAAVAFLSSCEIARTQLSAWPNTAHGLNNDQFSDFLSSHLGLMPPVLQPAVGKPVKALKSGSTTEWRELGPLDCRATNLLAAAFTEGADYNTRHDPLRDRLHVEARASGIRSEREATHTVLEGLAVGHRTLLEVATTADTHRKAAKRATQQATSTTDTAEVTALQHLATAATRAATDAGLAAAKVDHAVQHMRGIRPDIVFTDDSAGGKTDVVEVKTISFCPSWYGVRFAANGDTWVEARAREAVKERDSTAAKLDAALFPEVQPPPITSQVQGLGGVTAAVIGAFCEHSPEIHAMTELWATRRAPKAADDLGFTLPLAMAHERHCIRLRLAAGAWRDFSKSIRARLPFVHTSAMDAVVQADLSRCDERTEREYRNHAESFARGNHGAGGGDRNQRGLFAPANQNHTSHPQ